MRTGRSRAKRNRDDVEGTVLDTHLVQVKTFFFGTKRLGEHSRYCLKRFRGTKWIRHNEPCGREAPPGVEPLEAWSPMTL